jgi:hypothetical protein
MNMNATALKTLLFLSLIYLFPLFGNSWKFRSILTPVPGILTPL